MKKHLLIFPLFLAFSILVNPSFAFDFFGDASIETAYDTNIEGVTGHSIGEVAGKRDEDFLTIASMFLNIGNDKKQKIQYNLSFNEIDKFYFDEYVENTNRHIGEANISIPLNSVFSLNIDNRSILHFQPKEDIRNFFSNFSSISLRYELSDRNTLSVGYMNNIKKYPNNNKWNFIKNSFFFQATHHFSHSFWLTGAYEGVLYRGNNNFHFDKEEEENNSSIFDNKTAKGNEHRFTLSANKIFNRGSALSFKYRFTSNDVDEVIDVEEDRELAEFDGVFAYENDEQDFNYTLNEATLVFSMPIINNVALDIILLYQFQNFDGDAFLLEDKRARRLDRLAVADISLSLKLNENIELKLRNAYTCNESNYPEREYKRNYTSASLNCSF